MKKYIAIFIFSFLFTNTSFGQTHPNSDLLEKSVVVVMALDYNRTIIAWGSGVIIDSKGTIITNYHVLEDGYYIKIRTEQGDEFDMDKIIAENSNCDLIKFTIKNPTNVVFTAVKVSKAKPKKAEDVWAMGTPDDIKNINQISHGGITNIFTIQDYKILQTDAKIAHGSSGGGLFNSLGELIGITGGKFKGDDATLAGRNIAIAVGAFSKLYPVNKERLESAAPIVTKTFETPHEAPKYKTPEPEPPKYVPSIQQPEPAKGTVSFYTDWDKGIDKIQINYIYRTISKYWSNGAPRCGQDGTATFVLPPGTYSYTAESDGYILLTPYKYHKTGTVTIVSNECTLVYLPCPFNNKRSNKEWVIGTDFSHGMFVDKYFDKQKYRLQFLAYHQTSTCNKFGIDFERVFSTHNHIYDINFGLGPSIRYQIGSCNVGNQYAFNTVIGGYTTPDRIVSINSLFLNFRVSSEIIICDRILFHASAGYGYSTQGWGLNYDPFTYAVGSPFTSRANSDYEIYLGYKFGIKHKDHYHKQSVFLKYAPQIILPGWTDLKLSKCYPDKKSYNKKGKCKMALFLTTSTLAFASNCYYKTEYDLYKNSSEHNIIHYNNANLANKISMISTGFAGSLYLYDVIHFFSKLKILK